MAERPGSRMAKVQKLPLPWSECICPICQEILLEPVTLPCKHTLCNPCFQMTVEKASLCCPFCRKRVSTWARQHSRTRTLVNKELWEVIQKQYPKQCQRRASGQESDDLSDELTSCPVPVLCKPGEIRQEYEAEVSKIEAERTAQEEAERKASEDYIQKLLAEEEAEENLHAEASQREIEEQLKRDEELARLLSGDMDLSNASCTSVSPVTSKKVVSKSSKIVKSKQRVSGDIERFLSPKPRRALAAFGINESRNSDTSGSCILLDEDEDEDEIPDLSPQCPSTSLIQERDVELPMPYLPNCYKLESDAASQQDSCSERNDICNGTYSCSDSIDVEVSKTMEQQRATADSQEYRMETNAMSYSTPKRKCEECYLDIEEKAGSCQSVKKKKLSLSEDSPVLSVHAGKFIELEENLYERRKQEEHDRLFALQLQRELDKELKQVNRGKGSPDEYQLRPKRGLKLQDSPLPHNEQTPVQDKGGNTQSGYSPDENKKPSRKKSITSSQVRQSRAVTNTERSSEGMNVLKPSNKQPTILDLFQRSAGK
ncbi:hypothetical protein XENTR_v10014834 [Xenopus tropicalis]|uniref:RING-type E3 ubiquitin transferase n=1 Tax=Xenopus tropicalis TaxID=8364 RepID=F7BPQ0_XENTR|nr:E3 ubiquitin-protein ligase rnf168 isoform X1 [Xenopus tropicalis]KAE8604804.1 hypothetical protein XENTR_v10014834 [Xenopus tropicalis]|eukprot:XP_012825502.1 PREDICTED: E3 ubiquitin-protein ligase RNF168 isoform X1 [Xenopus tropicalis]